MPYSLSLMRSMHYVTALLCSWYILYLLMNVAGGVTEVKTDIFVTSFGPVSDVEMVRYYICQEVYLRSQWEIIVLQ